MSNLRQSKKQATRDRISSVATALFFARGFDAVTLDEVAAAAQVSRMTVHNYFKRKEDLFLDREYEVRDLIKHTVGGKPKDPIGELRGLIDKLVDDGHPFVRVDAQTISWWKVVAASTSLTARVREVGDEVTELLARELTPTGKDVDGVARLVAGTLLLTWRTAYAEALRVFERGGSPKKTSATFIALVDRGFAAARSLKANA